MQQFERKVPLRDAPSSVGKSSDRIGIPGCSNPATAEMPMTSSAISPHSSDETGFLSASGPVL
jgi:hypothetical protein